jgi:hypothetical protein
MDKEKVMRAGTNIAIITALVGLASTAFTIDVRKLIWARDEAKCQECDGKSCTSSLECAHYDHDRNNPDYNHPDNGRLLCSGAHLNDHVDNAGDNGLSRNQNNWAIEQIRKRINKES